MNDSEDSTPRVAPDAAAPAAAPRAKRRRHGWVSASFLGVLVVALAAWHLGLRLSLNSEFGGMASLPAANDLAIIRPTAPPPGSTNAAVGLEAAYATFPLEATSGSDDISAPYFEMGALPTPSEPLDDAVRAEMLAILERHAEGMALIDDALQSPHCVYVRDYDHGYNAPLSQIPHIRRGVGLYCSQAMLRSEAGDSDGAIESLERAILLGESLRSDRSGLSLATRLSTRPLVLTTCRWLVNDRTMTPDQYRRLADLMLIYEDDDALADAYRSELAMGLHALDEMRYGKVTPLTDMDGLAWTADEAWRFRALGLDKLELLRYTRAMATMEDAVLQPLPDRYAACREAVKSYRSLPSPGIARTLVFQGALFARSEAEHLGRSRAAYHALSVLAAEGKPGDIAPIDPFTGEPISLLLRDGRLIAYSYGVNGTNDEGYERPQEDHGYIGLALDIAFDVRVPPDFTTAIDHSESDIAAP